MNFVIVFNPVLHVNSLFVVPVLVAVPLLTLLPPPPPPLPIIIS
jgi:hypothetical protein